ncbi:ABC transporter substrate-binding protein [bacterium]|jgi:putative tryptophan/tyrosine transport system substrate-binding protein|nr:ABC transporter substrate-binding protein [bacterium]
MKNLKRLATQRLAATLIIITLAILSSLLINRKKKNCLTIGILQTASHPALDAARTSFVNSLRKTLGNRVNFVTRNAQGIISNAHTIAQSFHNNKNIDGILAIATPAAQAMANIEKKKPIFITAITDPNKLGLIHKKTNVCGSSDVIDIDRTVRLLSELAPKAKTVAIIFNTGEVSSADMAETMKQKLQKNGLSVISLGITQECDIIHATQKACKDADAVLTPIDNTIASTISLMANKAKKAHKPLIVSDNLLVEKGALAAAGTDYKTCGLQAAECALMVFEKNIKPANIKIMKQKAKAICINKTLCKYLGIQIPQTKNCKIICIEEKI